MTAAPKQRKPRAPRKPKLSTTKSCDETWELIEPATPDAVLALLENNTAPFLRPNPIVIEEWHNWIGCG